VGYWCISEQMFKLPTPIDPIISIELDDVNLTWTS
jgi:hypothetical protein